MITSFNPEKIKVLVFDVDDTVTRGTLGIKKNAWNVLFNNKLEKLQEARELYEYTGAGDRYNMIAHILDEDQNECTSNSHVQQWADKFEVLVQEQIRENGMHADDIKALIALKNDFNGLMYLLSATPQDSVTGNIEYFQKSYPELQGIFKEIIGNPMDGGKAGELQKIAQVHNCIPQQLLMVGDGGSDYNGATGAGTQFVGLNPDNRKDKWPNDSFPKIEFFADLPSLFGNSI